MLENQKLKDEMLEMQGKQKETLKNIDALDERAKDRKIREKEIC